MKAFNGYMYEISGSALFNAKTFKPISKVDPDRAELFETNIVKLLTTIEEDTEVGKRILRAGGIGRTVAIVPGTIVMARPLHGNAALPKGYKQGPLVGTGEGSDGVVFVNVSDLNLSMGPAAQKDAILLHEIVHAVRSSNGLLQQVPMGVYDDLEEFYAVTLANMYVSSKYPGKPLRGDHRLVALHKPDGYDQKAIGLTSQPAMLENHLYYFVMTYKEQLLKLNDEMEALCLALKDAKCKFNPFRVLYNGYDPEIEEKDIPAARRHRGFGPLVRETFAQVAERTMKNVDLEKSRRMFGGSILDSYGGL